MLPARLHYQMSGIVAKMMIMSYELQTVRQNLGNSQLSPGSRMILAGMEQNILDCLQGLANILRG